MATATEGAGRTEQLEDGSGRPYLAAVIPALNEAPAIGAVVDQLRAQRDVTLDQIIVVDNGSTDGTGAIARTAGADIVWEECRGYGRACLAGVRAATNAEVIVLLDGDAADDPRDLARIAGPVLCGEVDLVVGSRTLGVYERGALTPQQIVGNRVATWLIRALYGLHVTDLGPLRAIRRADLLALEPHELTYGWSTEMLVKAARAGYRYREVPVRYRRRVGASKVGGTLTGSLRAGWCVLTTIIRYVRWSPAPRIGQPLVEVER